MNFLLYLSYLTICILENIEHVWATNRKYMFRGGSK
jgi:hypothetical protein